MRPKLVGPQGHEREDKSQAEVTMEEALEHVVGEVLKDGGAATLCEILSKALAHRESEIATRGEGWCHGQLLAVNAMRTALSVVGRELGARARSDGDMARA